MTAPSDIFAAIAARDLGQVGQMLDAQPDLLNARNENGDSPLLMATYMGLTDIVDLLLSRKPVLNIFEAAALGKIGQVRKLLEEDPRQLGFFSHDGWTPLHLAAHFGQREVVEFLLDLGADLHAISQNSNTVMPLHSALSRNQIEIALLLIDRGADVNAAQLTHGYTPLHYAAVVGSEEVIKKLTEAGADPFIAALDGKLPTDLAMEKGHTTAAELLRRPR